jgi:hypothetical protein
VEVFPLKRIQDERGMVMHKLRDDDPHFEKFGEIYFSVVYSPSGDLVGQAYAELKLVK